MTTTTDINHARWAEKLGLTLEEYFAAMDPTNIGPSERTEIEIGNQLHNEKIKRIDMNN